jgi:mannose-6-phosphate isomerase-like protein (cupin superfamily)
MIKEIYNNKTLLAIIIPCRFKSEGIEFFTPNDYSQQLGYMNRKKGHVIEPHVHNPVSREVHFTKEVLYIKSGKVRVDFYDNSQNYLESYVLNTGDFILLAFGGHGFEMLESSEIFEIKQGPYAGDQDKTRFGPVSQDLIKINEN